jgi:predicted CoA-substrate-specific enzyme activase
LRVSRRFSIGVDVGSTTWKAVALNEEKEVVATKVAPTEPRLAEQTVELLAEIKGSLGQAADFRVGATGYGRKRIDATQRLTEITCHARGAFFRTGRGGLLIDMGGQDTKVIQVDDRGGVGNFTMNDKCAAGTGRFLEVILGRLRVPYEEVAVRVRAAKRSVPVSSTCTVFAESEVVSLVADGEPVEGILRGLHESLAARVVGLAGAVDGADTIFMSGGVALNGAMVDALANAFRRSITVLESPQLTGALGAALSV